MRKILKWLGAMGAVAYPVGVYFGLKYYEPRWLALFLCALLLTRIFSGNMFLHGKDFKKYDYRMAVIIFIMLGLILYTFGSNELTGLKLYPVIMSYSLFFYFYSSLSSDVPVIEKFARISSPDLSDDRIKYTRKLTKIWCVFFLLNGSIALYTSIYSSMEIWTLYNGLISYLLIGGLLGGEYLYRHLFLKT